MKLRRRSAAIVPSVRIRPRRGIAFRWFAWREDSDPPRAWARSPVALAWRRRQRNRLPMIVRTLAAAAAPAVQATKIQDVRRETWLTLTRLFERHVSLESRALTIAPAILAARQAPPGGAPPSLPARGQHSRTTSRPRVEQQRPVMQRPAVSAPTGSKETPGRAAGHVVRLAHRQSVVRDARPPVARRSNRQTGSPSATAVAPSPAAQPAAWPTQRLRRVASRANHQSSSPGRLSMPPAPIATRRSAQPPQPLVSAAVAALMMPVSPALVWRSVRTAASPATNFPTQSTQHPATGDSARPSLQVQPAVSSPMVTARTAAETERAALALTGPAMDRLAEDVMQRIERRIRIERERRGL
jgi:hypothetical protein